ncbi:hypothetical protein NYR58_08785, partial [Chelativorans intermedius]|nr:hypothetical protein [Chelativorans intermedius]
MARNTAAKADEDSFVKELEAALELDAEQFKAADGDLDIAASMEELEAQISLAAEELAREGNGENGAAGVEKAQPAVASRRDNDHPAHSGPEHAAPAPRAKEAADEARGRDTAARETARKPQPDQDQETLRPVTPQPASSAPPFAPANDDRQDAAASLRQRFQRPAPRTIYWLVAALSLLWIGGAAVLGNILYGPSIWEIRSVGGLLASPQAIGLVVGALVPVILFWGFAVMIRRAQEMRLAAQQMADVAARLLEPENLAQERVMKVGQAVRREVQAMGDGIERTLARAVELETLVHTEVNELERAYSENEARIRLLVDSLGSEREGIVSHAERVRASITGAHEILKEELDSAGEQIRLSVDSAAQRLTQSLGQAGESLVERISSTGTSIYTAMDERADTLARHITSAGDNLSLLLDSRIEALGTSAEEFIRRMETSSETVTRALNERSETLAQRIAQSGDNLSSLLDSRIEALGTS